MLQWQAFLLTLLCELPVLVLLARQQPFWRVLLITASASCLTHPLAWKIASVLSQDQYLVGLGWIELVVVMVEAIWYQYWLRAGRRKSFTWSLLANATSFGIGGWVL